MIWIFALLFAGLVFACWGMYCNDKTYQQRSQIITAIHDTSYSDWFVNHKYMMEAADAFAKISYEQHMWALIFFSDPKKLYSDEVRRELDGYVVRTGAQKW